MSVQIISAQDGCHETHLSLSGGKQIPSGLGDYTDGYCAEINMIIGSNGVYAESMEGTCFGATQDKQGVFCYGVLSGADYELVGQSATYWSGV